MLEQLSYMDGTAAYSWIELQLQEPPTEEPHRVSSCLPDVFERYVKVLNPFHLLVGTTLDESLASLTTASQVRLQDWRFTRLKGLAFEPLPFHRLRLALDLPVFPEINWKTVQAKLGRWLPVGMVFPDEDTLSPATCQTLISALKPFTAGPVYFHFWLLAFDWDQDGFFIGQLEDVTETFGMNRGLTPTTWWPDDRSWCLTTPYDLTFSLIGGSWQLIDQLLKHPDLDCVEVYPSTRVNDRSGLQETNEGSQASYE